MSIIRKVKAIERVFRSLDEEINKLKKETGLKCITGCGKCCISPNIEASPLEFLPLAFEWFRNGLANEIFNRLQDEKSPICINYSPFTLENIISGSCIYYTNRGLICRLFGYSSSRDKNGNLRFITCKIIKEDQKDSLIMAKGLFDRNVYVPVASDYYKKLYQIDFKLASQVYPINKAMKIALEEVMHYYSYRRMPVIKRSA